MIPGALADDLDAVQTLLGTARGLPRLAYDDAAVFERERSALLAPAFHLVCRETELSRPGTVQLASVLGTEILLARGPDLELRGFFNVCRHRGSALLDASAAGVSELVCPYHGQRYDLRGRSIHQVPCLYPDPVPPGTALRRVRVETFGGWVFASLAPDGPSLLEQLGDVPEAIRALGLRSLVETRRTSFEVAANWKLLVENFLESHHYPLVHPALEALTPHRLAETLPDVFPWNGGLTVIDAPAETVSSNGERGGRAFLPGLAEEERDRVRDYHVSPTLLLSRQPDYLLTYRLEPLEPHRTRVHHALLIHPQSAGPHDDLSGFWDQVNREDARAVERQQRGVSSLGYEPGPLSPREDGLLRFLHEMAAFYRSQL